MVLPTTEIIEPLFSISDDYVIEECRNHLHGNSIRQFFKHLDELQNITEIFCKHLTFCNIGI